MKTSYQRRTQYGTHSYAPLDELRDTEVELLLNDDNLGRPPIINGNLQLQQFESLQELVKYTYSENVETERKGYTRIITTDETMWAQCVIFSVNRAEFDVKDRGNREAHVFQERKIIANEKIHLPDSNQWFQITAVIMKTHHSHFVCLAKCAGSWYYYNDNTRPYTLQPMVGETLSKVALSCPYDPFTNGTQYVYTACTPDMNNT